MESKIPTTTMEEEPTVIMPGMISVKVEPVTVEPEIVIVESEIVAVEPESVTVELEFMTVEPEFMTVEPEFVTCEPEFVTVKQEPSWCGSLHTDTAIKNEPASPHQTFADEIGPHSELEMAEIIQESYNEEGFFSKSPPANSFRKIPQAYSNPNYELIHGEPKFPSTTTTDKTFQQAESVASIKNTNLRKHICDICGKRYRSKEKLYNHKRTHTNEKLICDICQKEFIKKSVLNRHLRVHTQEKPFKCKTCRKKFSQQCNLIRHEQIHTGTKPHLCQICKKHFANASYLKLHVRVHTGEKPYSCDVCEKPFAVVASLKRHRLTHEAGQTSKPRKRVKK